MKKARGRLKLEVSSFKRERLGLEVDLRVFFTGLGSFGLEKIGLIPPLTPFTVLSSAANE